MFKISAPRLFPASPPKVLFASPFVATDIWDVKLFNKESEGIASYLRHGSSPLCRLREHKADEKNVFSFKISFHVNPSFFCFVFPI